MSTVSHSLKSKIDKAQHEKHKVLVTLREGAEIEKLGVQGQMMMDNTIMAASLSKEEIAKLSANKDVLAVENDEEMTAI